MRPYIHPAPPEDQHLILDGDTLHFQDKPLTSIPTEQDLPTSKRDLQIPPRCYQNLGQKELTRLGVLSEY